MRPEVQRLVPTIRLGREHLNLDRPKDQNNGELPPLGSFVHARVVAQS